MLSEMVWGKMSNLLSASLYIHGSSLTKLILTFHFKGWNFNRCMGTQGTGVWYVDYHRGKCSRDCEEGSGQACGGLVAGGLEQNLYANPRDCCGDNLFWIQVDFCEVCISCPHTELQSKILQGLTILLQPFLFRPYLLNLIAMQALDIFTVVILLMLMCACRTVVQAVSTMMA